MLLENQQNGVNKEGWVTNKSEAPGIRPRVVREAVMNLLAKSALWALRDRQTAPKQPKLHFYDGRVIPL